MTTAAGSRSPWDALVQRAVLGTERTATSPRLTSSGDLGSVLDRLDTSDSERALLAAGAIVGMYEAAGRLPTRVVSQPVALAKPESEDFPPAPPAVARFLATMLGGVNDEVLPEWLALTSARGWRAPTPLLPALLEAGRKAAPLRDGIVRVLGARGSWLAARNDDWAYAAGHAPLDDSQLRAAWETGTPQERSAILTYLRLREPALGRELLERTWPNEAPSQRAAFLTLLLNGLALDDEPFLERALDDRRQEVRRVAAELLSRLPGSALVARMTDRARAALSWKAGKLVKRGEIVVTPPSELDAGMERDGVYKKPPQGMGERAWWLAQIIAAVPPTVWSDTWKLAPDALISAATAGDWAIALADGWAMAAVWHQDPAWAEALLARGFPGEKATPVAPDREELLAVLPIERREALIAKSLRDDPTGDVVIALVMSADHAWSDSFAQTVLKWVRKRIVTKSGTAGDWHLRELLPRIALRVPPSLASATEDWPLGKVEGLGPAMERFITTLTFRRELAECIRVTESAA